jgi:hypothetical protein
VAGRVALAGNKNSQVFPFPVPEDALEFGHSDTA